MASGKKNMVYLETMGCQMNKLDSELVLSRLTEMGYRTTDDPEQAGVIIYNTCSVRQHAEDKVISKVGHLRRRHREDKDLTLAVIGCMAQRQGQKMLDEHPEIDIVCGPGQIHRLGEMIQANQARRQQILLKNNRGDIAKLEELDASRKLFDQQAPFSAYVRVIRGCSKFCHFCVVPFTRGLESSRPIENIYEETRKLVDQGVQEITLIGQTVNSYHYVNGRQYNLADVMARIHDLQGLRRIRFVTCYPTDFHDEIMQAMADLDKVCPYLHMPAQSGSERILKTMNRHYTRRQYLDLIARYRSVVPEISIAGDIIVGYCGETEDDFDQTKDLLRKVRFKNNYIFQYSPRPKTQADKQLPDDVPAEIKSRRNHELLALQNQISLEDNQRFIGQTVQILVEGPSKKPHLNAAATTLEPTAPVRQRASTNPTEQSPTTAIATKPMPATLPKADTLGQLVGRTPTDHIVVFNANKNLTGKIINLKVTKASALTLFAQYP